MSTKTLCSLLFSMFFVGAVQTISAQETTTNGNSTQSNEGTIDDLIVKSMRLPALQEIGGSPFMSPDYKTGKVIIDNDLVVSDVPVKFNIFSNAIMVQKDGNEMRLESFKLVTYDDVLDPANIKHFEFGQGFPEVDNHTDKSIYQILSKGANAQLLKYLTQKVEDVNTLGDYNRREIVTTEQLYLYVPGSGIKKIKSGKKDIKDALPALSAKIEEIATSKNLKLKSESEIVMLVDALNKP